MMAEKLLTGAIKQDTKLRPDDYLVYMIINIGLGAAATTLTYMNKQKVYAWFIFTFPDQLPKDDILQNMNMTIEGNAVFDITKGINADTIGGIQNDPKGAAEKATGIKVPKAPKLPDIPVLSKDEWEYDF